MISFVLISSVRAAAISRLTVFQLVLAPIAVAQAPDSLVVHADTISVDATEALLEPLVEDAVSGDPTDLLEMLQELIANPIDVNVASADELTIIPALTARLAAAIVEYRRVHGAFASISDLQLVDGIDEHVMLDARPYLTIGDPSPSETGSPRRFPGVPTSAEIRSGSRLEILQRVQRRIDTSRGYEAVPDSLLGTPDEPRRYLGSPERVYTRLRATYRRNLSANLTLEKDPGEPFTWDPENGFYGYDFTSFHLAALNVGRIDALVVGDFVAEFGEGVTLWRAAGFGKGRESIGPLVRRGRGIRPYSSTDENRFFRGAAATLAVTPHVFVSAFASRRHYDARFTEVDTTGFAGDVPGIAVAGMPQTGLHRTHAEIAQKNALGQTLGGGGLEVRLPRARIGVVGYHAGFDEPITAGHLPYQRFNFEGTHATMASVYGNAFLGDYYFFGEVARDPGGAFGGIGGIEGEIGPLEALLLVRHYPRDFNSLHGYAFGERNGITQNETGVYLGMRLRPTGQWTLSGYFDQFRFPWARFGVNRPSTGHDALLFVEHRPRRWLTLYVQGRAKTRETGMRVTTATGAELDALTTEARQTLRLQGEYVANRDLRLRVRIETARYRRADEDLETGVVLFHDLRWAASRAIMIDTRLTYFDTDSFNARLYQFEGDLHGVMTNALLSGRGMRFYTVLSLRPGGVLSGLDARFKFAVTSYRDRHFIGSGLDQIEGSRVRDVGLQVRYTFGG